MTVDIDRVIHLWTSALRSGEYIQTTGTLQTTVGHCCLGVLCEVADKENIFVERNGIDGLLDGVYLGNQKDVFEWCGLNNEGGRFKCPIEHLGSLWELNDRGYTFLQIADIIESIPEGLFRDAG